MRIAIISVLSSIALLGGCATAGHGGMGHGRMSHEEMMRHCQMMEQHAAAAQPQGTPPASDAMGHGAMSHDGMSHEQMMRHCEMMQRQQAAPAAAPPAAPLPH